MKPLFREVDITTAVASLRTYGQAIVVSSEGEEFKVVTADEGEGCKTLVEAVESIVLASFGNQPSLSVKDILKRWLWYGVPMPPKPSEEELRAAMVVAAEKPEALVRWANRGRDFRDPKASPTGDDEPRLQPTVIWKGIAK